MRARAAKTQIVLVICKHNCICSKLWFFFNLPITGFSTSKEYIQFRILRDFLLKLEQSSFKYFIYQLWSLCYMNRCFVFLTSEIHNCDRWDNHYTGFPLSFLSFLSPWQSLDDPKGFPLSPCQAQCGVWWPSDLNVCNYPLFCFLLIS